MDTLLQDLRYALRTLARSPGFTLAATLTLALGIGANTTVFSLVNALLLRPLPVAAPEELVDVERVRRDGPDESFSYPAYRAFRDGNRVFAGLAAHSGTTVSLGGSRGGEAERVEAQLVSGNYFRVLGVRPARGRAFGDEEDGGGAPRTVAVMGHGLWRRAFGGDPGVIGKTVRVNGHAFTVVGIAPEGFKGTIPGEPAELWVPLAAQPEALPLPFLEGALERPGLSWLEVVGRLRPGVAAPQAEAALRALDRRVRPVEAVQEGEGLAVRPAARGDGAEREDLSRRARILMAVTAFVLLVACANVAGLARARASARGREVAVRRALGAGRGRLVRQLLAESLLLAFAGAALGVLLAVWSRGLLAALAPGVELDLPLDGRVLAATAAAAALAGVAFGTAPALAATRAGLLPALRGDPAAAGREEALSLRGVLTAAQMALTLVLLVGALLFVRTFRNLQAVDVGTGRGEVLSVSFDLSQHGYDVEEAMAFQGRLLEAVRGLPGVRSAAVAASVPLGGGGMRSSVNVEGQEVPEDLRVVLNPVSPGYFEAVGILLLRGRGFAEGDREGAPAVTVVSEALARRFWPGEDPLGKRVGLGGEMSVVVGVARDARVGSLREEPPPVFYAPLAQFGSSRSALLVRSAGEPAALVPLLRGTVADLDPEVALYDARTLEDRVREAMAPERATAALAGAFALLALALAATGIFGVVSYRVALRTREIGVRVALGARPGQVEWLVLRRGLALAAAGTAAGLAGALALVRTVEGLLYGVSPTDPLTFAAVPLLLAAVALLASWLPARRAAQLDPMTALRAE